MKTQTENSTKRTSGTWRHCMFADKIPNFSIKSGIRTLALVNYYAGNPEHAAANDITEGEANAEFICQAVNQHDQLVAQRDALLNACRMADLAIIDEKKLQASRGESVSVTLGIAHQELTRVTVLCEPNDKEGEWV